MKLEEFANSLVKESESLKGIYLELSEKERKDFFRRIHNMEIALQVIYQETIIKKKFLMTLCVSDFESVFVMGTSAGFSPETAAEETERERWEMELGQMKIKFAKTRTVVRLEEEEKKLEQIDEDN